MRLLSPTAGGAPAGVTGPVRSWHRWSWTWDARPASGYTIHIKIMTFEPGELADACSAWRDSLIVLVSAREAVPWTRYKMKEDVRAGRQYGAVGVG